MVKERFFNGSIPGDQNPLDGRSYQPPEGSSLSVEQVAQAGTCSCQAGDDNPYR